MKKNDLEKNRRAIRNSTVDFLIFTKDASEDSIEVRVQDGEVWLTQDGIAQLFDVDRSVVTKHLKNIFQNGSWQKKKLVQNLHKLLTTENLSISFRTKIIRVTSTD